jgi:hypothetical protein
MKAVIDNDILFKGACYGLLSELLATICSSAELAGVLGSSRFVLPKKIQGSKLRRDKAAALAGLFEFLASRTEELEPTDSEQSMAADLELRALELGLNLDSGESQLCAILVHRVLLLLLTGDKRAIAAMEGLIVADSRLAPLCGKVTCLEQLVLGALAQIGSAQLKSAICAEPETDKALTICFSCGQESVPSSNFAQGLHSYISAVRASASRALAP